MGTRTPFPAVEPHISGNSIMVVSQGFYAIAGSRDAALAAYRTLRGKTVPLDEWVFYSVHPDTRIDDMGCLRFPRGEHPVMLCRSN